ncbi:T9SS type A sorting domain-containing protein [Saccharicrinis aurantiacus]|uniref:T9SS type A sorting domain-containing protein n=1 Tax=Saccharicrinis aurantiacus TaxID=1849719 RepID=UPI0024936CB0|nr:T9SS type A sorting domain-containing protein [Saccharicrinis aurantiacus]
MRRLILLPLFLVMLMAQVRVNACEPHSSNVCQIGQAIRNGHVCTDTIHSACSWGGSGKVNKKFTPSPFSQLKSGGQKKSEFELILFNFPSTESEEAFKYAVSIWEKSLATAAPVRIFAYWSRNLPTGALAGCSPEGYERNFYGQTMINTFYPRALHNKLTYTDHEVLDMSIVINSNLENWYYGTDGETPVDSYDFVTVMLHELAHGFGMQGTCNGRGFYKENPKEYTIFDRHIEDSIGNKIDDLKLYPSYSEELFDALRNQLYFNGELATKANGDKKVPLYTPDYFMQGSSVYHLDTIFDNDDANSLLTFQLDLGRAIHTPGPILLGVLKDIGWDVADISHTVKDLDNAQVDSKEIEFSVASEYDVEEVKLFYKKSGEKDYIEAPVSAKDNNKYSATLSNLEYNNTYNYYINISDKKLNDERSFNFPTNALIKPSVFVFGEDLIAPEVSEVTNNINVWLPYRKSFKVSAEASDNYAIEQVLVRWTVDGVQQNDVEMTLNTETGLYSGDVMLPEGLTNASVVSYKVEATDMAANPNTTLFPEGEAVYSVKITEFNYVDEDYATDFEDENIDSDFLLNGMRILKPSDKFKSKSLNTPHPYDVSTAYSATFCNKVLVKDGAKLRFDEIVMVEGGKDGYKYPSPYFYDFALIQGSIDNGETWEPLIDGYDAGEQQSWTKLWSSFLESGESVPPNSLAFADSTYYVNKEIDLVRDTYLEEGDEVLIRFVMVSDIIIFGWGWSIDNLSISYEDPEDVSVATNPFNTIQVIPNPAKDNITINAPGIYNLEVYNLTGAKIKSLQVTGLSPIYIGDLLKGMYVLKIKGNGNSVSKKLLKQ